jgi:hypothetical protein
MKALSKFGENSSSETYSTSSGVVSNNKPQVPVDMNKNFQSIYKLIEETFQFEKRHRMKRKEINENEKEIDDGMNEMREIIKIK